MPKQRQIHIDCIYMIFLWSELSSGLSNGFDKQMHTHIGCIYTIFLQSVFSYGSSSRLIEHLHSHIDCICEMSDQNRYLTLLLNNSSNFLMETCSLWWQIPDWLILSPISGPNWVWLLLSLISIITMLINHIPILRMWQCHIPITKHDDIFPP